LDDFLLSKMLFKFYKSYSFRKINVETLIIEIKNEKNVFLFNKSVVASNGFENHSKQIAR